MNGLDYVFGAICIALYVIGAVFLWLMAGTRCVFCNRLIKIGRARDYHGAPVCFACWKRIREGL